ncbi:unnamed protein product [Paramecium primaurelia]|uniref:Tetratricopeptide repeat protein n=1 Tax=Paramecium primaurelia TaxID=5886 RepID=A0A8S1KND8_PARPR|nr:unnamed protein product [Paramecium primaurelia]
MNELKLLERLPARKTNIKMNFVINGVFSFPEEWRVTDEANPNLFQYSVAFLDQRLSGGKIIPRELTEKEKREIEEAEAAKKAKKQPKKDAKIEPPKLTPEEEKEKLLKEQLELEEQQKLKAEWDALTEEEQFYKTQEDQYKSPSIKFDQNQFTQELTGQKLVIQQERVRVDKGEWIFLYKSPIPGDEEVAKLKKTKPKTLNINDLNIIVFKAWIDYLPFQKQGQTETIQRIKFTQYMDEQFPPETPKPNIETMYMYLKINLSQPITPIRFEPQPTFQDLIPLAPEPQPIPLSQQCIEELRSDLQVIIESLAMEYSNMFSKDLNKYQNEKQSNMLMTHKKQSLQQRKEHFLYDFNISGKYKILKERIKKSIVKLCRDKFGKSGSVTGISTDQSDQFYSELYVFLMEEMRQVLINMVRENKEALQEDFSHLLSKKKTIQDIGFQEIITEKTNETRKQQLERLCQEYEILNRTEEVEKHLRDLNLINPKDQDALMKFAFFCLRCVKIEQAVTLVEQALSYDGHNQQNQLLLAGLYQKREKVQESKFILELLLDKDPNNLIYHLFYYLIIQQTDQELADFMMQKAERIWLRQLNLIKQEGMHHEDPQLYDIPWIKIPIPVPDKPEKDKAILEQREQQRIAWENAHNQPQLTEQQYDQMILQLVEFFENASLLEQAEESLSLLNDKSHSKIVMLRAKIFLYKSEYSQCLDLIENMLEFNPENLEMRIEYIKVLFKSQSFDKCEKQIKFVLPNPKLREDQNTYFSMYLMLGSIYINEKQFGNARAVFTKACQINENSSLSWMGLGISSHECGKYKEAEDALRMANLYEPTNDTVWGYIALNCLKDGKRFRDANSALKEMNKTDTGQVNLMVRLSKEFYNIKEYLTAKELLQKAINWAKIQDMLKEEINQFEIQLAETNEKLGLLQQALDIYQEILNGECGSMQEHIKQQINRLHFQINIQY